MLWVVWALIWQFLTWQGRQPVLILPEVINQVLFIFVGVFTGFISISWALVRWHQKRNRLSALKTLEDIMELPPEGFEQLVAKLFQVFGHEAEITNSGSDHGVDVIVTSTKGEKWVVQCKRYRGTVGEPVVRDLYGTMLHEGAQSAYLITTGTFSKQATVWAEGKPIVLFDGEALVRLVRQAQKNRRMKRMM